MSMITCWMLGAVRELVTVLPAALRITRQFEADFVWRLHNGKSRVFTDRADVGRVLAAAAGFLWDRSFSDLGVVCHAGGRSLPAVRKDRCPTGLARFALVRRLPVPFEAKCRFAAASATAASLYGASCGGRHRLRSGP